MRQPGFWDVDPARTKTKPWPGKAPTRWRILIEKPNGHCVIHNASPCAFNAQKIMAYCAQTRGQLTLVEYDRLGAIKRLTRPIPRKSFVIQARHSVLDKFYHLQLLPDSFFSTWPEEPVNLLLDGHSWFCWVPNGLDLAKPADLKKLHEFKKWIRAQHFFEKKRRQMVAAKHVRTIDLNKLPALVAPLTINCRECFRPIPAPSNWVNPDLYVCGWCGCANFKDGH